MRLSVVVNGRSADLSPIRAKIRAEGRRSLRHLASELNGRGIYVPRGWGWTAEQVKIPGED